MHLTRELYLCIFYVYTNCVRSAYSCFYWEGKLLPECKNVSDFIAKQTNLSRDYEQIIRMSHFDDNLEIYGDITKLKKTLNLEDEKQEEECLKLFKHHQANPDGYREDWSKLIEQRDIKAGENCEDGLINSFRQIGLGSTEITVNEELDGRIIECFKACADITVLGEFIEEFLDKLQPRADKTTETIDSFELDTLSINDREKKYKKGGKRSHNLYDIAKKKTTNFSQNKKSPTPIQHNTFKDLRDLDTNILQEVNERRIELRTFSINIFGYNYLVIRTLLKILHPMRGRLQSYKPTNSMELKEIYDSVYKIWFTCFIDTIILLDQTVDKFYTRYVDKKVEIETFAKEIGMRHPKSNERFCKFINDQKFEPTEFDLFSSSNYCPSSFPTEKILFKNYCEYLFIHRFLIIYTYERIIETSSRRLKYYNYVAKLNETIDDYLNGGSLSSESNFENFSSENKYNTEFLSGYSDIKEKLNCLSQERKNNKLTKVLNLLKNEMLSINTKILWHLEKLLADPQMKNPTYFDKNITYKHYFSDMHSRVSLQNEAIDIQNESFQTNTLIQTNCFDIKKQFMLITEKFSKSNGSNLNLSTFVDEFILLKEAFILSLLAFPFRFSKLNPKDAQKTIDYEHLELCNFLFLYEDAVMARKNFLNEASSAIYVDSYGYLQFQVYKLINAAWLQIECNKQSCVIDQMIPKIIKNINNDLFINDIEQYKYEILIAKLQSIIDESEKEVSCEMHCIPSYEMSNRQRDDNTVSGNMSRQCSVVEAIYEFAKEVGCLPLIEQSESVLNKITK